RWIMKQAIGNVAYYFNSQRMMRRHVTEAYLRAQRKGLRWSQPVVTPRLLPGLRRYWGLTALAERRKNRCRALNDWPIGCNAAARGGGECRCLRPGWQVRPRQST